MPIPEIRTPISCIYALINDRTRRVYIGQTENYGIRMTNTINQLNAGIHRNLSLQNDWDLYGMSKFSFKVIQEESDDALRRGLEFDWMKRLRDTGRDLYNKNLKLDDGEDWE